MLKLTPFALTFCLLSLPTLASAQSMGIELDSPIAPPPGVSAAARATPEPSLEAAEIPEPPRQLSTPYSAQVDPEITALRNGEHPSLAPEETGYMARRRAHIARYELQLDRAAEREGQLSFGASTGLGWAGLGLGAGAGALIGLMGGGIACETENHTSCGGDLSIGAAMGAAWISPLGSAVAVWMHGDSQGAGGNFFAALTGSYLGAGVGAAIFAGMVGSGDLVAILSSPVGIAVGMVLQTLGAAAGYHLTSGPSESSSEHAGVMVLPTLAPTDDGVGATVGAMGTF